MRASRLVVLVALLLSPLYGAMSARALEFELKTTSDGTRFIVMSGSFEAGKGEAEFLTSVTDHDPTFVTFNSPGGNVETAIQIGRMIRTLGIATIQLRQLECSSACALAFLGGVYRAADSGAIGVHRSSFANSGTMNTDDAIVATQLGVARTMGYISEMGGDPALLQLAMQYDRSDMRYLSTSEMELYRVITPSQPAAMPAPQPQRPPSAALPSAPNQASTSMFDIPAARSGRVRHPKGRVLIKAGPEDASTGIASLGNGERVTILGREGRWYRVTSDQGIGYMHDTWVLVDQFESGAFSARHIQIKSFDNYAEAEEYIRSSPLRLSAYLATNGWFAITLEDTFESSTGAEVLKSLKAQGKVPDDAYMSYGNTYARKVCCSR